MQPLDDARSESGLTDEERAITRMIAARTAAGETIATIAKTSRVAPTDWLTYRWLLRLAKASGLRYQNRRPTPEEIEAVIKAVRVGGMTFRQAALAFGMSRTAVHRHVTTMRRKSIDQAGAFIVEDGNTKYSRSKREWHCPEHGRIVAWPCVACAALAAKRQSRPKT